MPSSTPLLITVFFDAPGFDAYPFTIEEYRIAYRELAMLIHERGAVFGIVRGSETYLGGERFSHGWLFDGSAFQEHAAPLTTNLIYNKGHFVGDQGCRVLNDPALDHLCTNKWATIQAYPTLSPKTVLVRSREELSGAAQQMTGDLLVCKPVDLEEGKGVVIADRETVLKAAATMPRPFLLQACIDTSRGIPGIVGGVHDLRIIGIGGEIGVAYIRTAPPESRVANVARGGREIEVPLRDIPPDALSLFRSIDVSLARFEDRLYSVDMGRDASGRWYLIELNSKPALSTADQGPGYPRFQRLIAELLIRAAGRG